jgi:hypothetical protein
MKCRLYFSDAFVGRHFRGPGGMLCIAGHKQHRWLPTFRRCTTWHRHAASITPQESLSISTCGTVSRRLVVLEDRPYELRVYDGEPEKHVFMPGWRPFIHEKQTTDRSHGEDRIGATPLQRASRIQPKRRDLLARRSCDIPIHLLIRPSVDTVVARHTARGKLGYHRRPASPISIPAACVPCSNNNKMKIQSWQVNSEESPYKIRFFSFEMAI